jgi:hypothetical protein
MRAKCSRGGWWLVVAVAGSLAFTAGCDPTLKTTVEDGVISVSTSFLGAYLRALLALGQEAQTATTTTTGTTTGGTAMLLPDAAQDVFA